MTKSWLKSTLILAILMGCIALPVSMHKTLAGNQRWSAWAFQQETRTLMLFVEQGTNPVNTYILPLPTDMTRIQGSVAISHLWNYFAYVASNEQGSRALVIYDRDQPAVSRIISLPAQSASSLFSNQYDWQATEGSFNQDSTSLAFGYAIPGGHWAIYIYSLVSNSSAANLTNDSSAVQGLHMPVADGWTPVVQRYNHTQIAFTLANASTSLPTHYDSYVWDTSTNVVTKTNAYPMVNADTLEPTGETVATGIDMQLAANANPGATNVLLAYDPATGMSAPFYTTSAVVMTTAKFIQNGERIVYSGFIAPSPQRHYTVVERSGTVVGDLTDPTISNLIGWQDGLIYVSNPVGGAQSLNVLNTRNGLNSPPDIAWTAAPGTPPLQLLETPTNMNSTGPFTAWAHLGQTSVPQPISTPTGQPTAQCTASYPGQVSIAFLNYRDSKIWINGLNANCQEYHMWSMVGNNTSSFHLTLPPGMLFVRIRDYATNLLLAQYTISGNMNGTSIAIH